jgi:hypothetical protein
MGPGQTALRKVKPSGGHLMKSRGKETALGLALVIVGCFLLWDAFDNRGKKMPWPMSGLSPF